MTNSIQLPIPEHLLRSSAAASNGTRTEAQGSSSQIPQELKK